jgi:hypothetical protein
VAFDYNQEHHLLSGALKWVILQFLATAYSLAVARRKGEQHSTSARRRSVLLGFELQLREAALAVRLLQSPAPSLLSCFLVLL